MDGALSIRIQRTFQLVSTPKAGEADFASVVEGLRKEAGRGERTAGTATE